MLEDKLKLYISNVVRELMSDLFVLSHMLFIDDNVITNSKLFMTF